MCLPAVVTVRFGVCKLLASLCLEVRLLTICGLSALSSDFNFDTGFVPDVARKWNEVSVLTVVLKALLPVVTSLEGCC